MYFSRIEPTRAIELERWDPYRVHQFLWEFFDCDPSAKRDFLYRHEQIHGRSLFYVVSMREPGRKQGWRTASKSYQPKIATGETLSFSLRVNPVVCRAGKRHDVIQNYKRGLSAEARQQMNLSDAMQETGVEWLAKRGHDAGFQVEKGLLRVSGYRVNRFRKWRKPNEEESVETPFGFGKGRDRNKPWKGITINSMDLDGRLVVTDEVRFHQTLFNGVGPAKSFGCGLLLVRR